VTSIPCHPATTGTVPSFGFGRLPSPYYVNKQMTSSVGPEPSVTKPWQGAKPLPGGAGVPQEWGPPKGPVPETGPGTQSGTETGPGSDPVAGDDLSRVIGPK